MTVYLARQGYRYSPTTIHKYMNTEMKLFSIVRPKKPVCGHAKPHKVFDNRLHQDFTAEKPNQKWCTDFTYLFLKNHEVRYNCTILDLYDRSVIASITDRNITSDLAVRTLKKALESQPSIKECRSNPSLIDGCDSNAFFSVRTARSLVIFRSVILAITLRS